MTEAKTQQAVRIAVSEQGGRVWRNNVGACKDVNGRLIRYGLANDSSQLNARIKSSDLIGIKPVVITEDMVGQVIGQFISYEIKAPGWKFTGNDREVAQAAWITLINSFGGDAGFITDVGQLNKR